MTMHSLMITLSTQLPVKPRMRKMKVLEYMIRHLSPFTCLRGKGGIELLS